MGRPGVAELENEKRGACLPSALPMHDILESTSRAAAGRTVGCSGSAYPTKGTLLGPSVPQVPEGLEGGVPGCQLQGGHMGSPPCGEAGKCSGAPASQISKKGNPTEAVNSILRGVVLGLLRELRSPGLEAASTIGDFGPMLRFTLETRDQWQFHMSCPRLCLDLNDCHRHSLPSDGECQEKDQKWRYMIIPQNRPHEPLAMYPKPRDEMSVVPSVCPVNAWRLPSKSSIATVNR